MFKAENRFEPYRKFSCKMNKKQKQIFIINNNSGAYEVKAKLNLTAFL